MTYQYIYRVKNDTYIKNDRYNCIKVKKQDKQVGFAEFILGNVLARLMLQQNEN